MSFITRRASFNVSPSPPPPPPSTPSSTPFHITLPLWFSGLPYLFHLVSPRDSLDFLDTNEQMMNKSPICVCEDKCQRKISKKKGRNIFTPHPINSPNIMILFSLSQFFLFYTFLIVKHDFLFVLFLVTFHFQSSRAMNYTNILQTFQFRRTNNWNINLSWPG